MTKQSDHDALVEAVAKAIAEQMFASHELPLTDPWLIAKYEQTARAALAVVRERLATVTPEMVEAWMDHDGPPDEAGSTEADAAAADWLAMLNASCLNDGDK